MQLDNPRHEAFAQEIARGSKGGAAYRKVYGDVRNPRGQASRLMQDEDICDRVKELQGASASDKVMSLQAEKEFLTLVIETPIDQIDETSVLCQRYRYKPDGSRELWMVDKLGAMRLLADLKKELSEKVQPVSVNIAVTVLTADRRRELQEKKRAAIERGLAQRN
jgi:hypothetical protein